MADVLRYTMTAFAEWHYRCGLFAAEPRLLPEHDAAVTEEDVRHQGEWPAWPILLEPAVVPLNDNSLALEFIVTQLLSWRKLLWHEERQVAARLDGCVDAGRCCLNEEGSSEIAFGVDTFGANRPAWPQVCGHNPDPTDVMFDRAVVGDVDAAAGIADGRLKAKPESPGFTDGVGDSSDEEDNGGDHNRDRTDNRGRTGNCIQHDHPVRLGERRPAMALVACMGKIAVASQPGVIASVWFRTATSSSYVGSLPVDIIVIYNLIFIYEYNSTRQFHYLLSC